MTYLFKQILLRSFICITSILPFYASERPKRTIPLTDTSSRSANKPMGFKDAGIELSIEHQDVNPESLSTQAEKIKVDVTTHHLSELGKSERFAKQQSDWQKWHREKTEIRTYSALSKQQFEHCLIIYINKCHQTGMGERDIQQSLLAQQHFYGLPAFVACVKDLPIYPEYIKQVYEEVQSKKGWWPIYAISKHVRCLPPGFEYKVENVEKLYQDLIQKEQRLAQKQAPLVRRLLNDYKVDLPPGAARTARIHAREKSLRKSMNGKSVTRSYHLSNSAEKLLIDNKQNPLFLSECIGTKLQQQLHKELVDIVNHTAELSTHPTIGRSPIPVGTIINLAQVSSEFNQQGEVVKGFAVADLSWAMLDFSKAVLEGVALGGKMVVNDLWDHPIEATATIVAGEYALMYQLAKVLHEVADISLKGMLRNFVMTQDPQKGVDQWVEFLKPTIETIDELSKKELSGRDSVKYTTAFVVGWKAQSKLFGVLNKFYSGTKTRVVEFAKKNPMATPEHYVTTPEGMVFRAASDASSANNVISTSISARAIVDKSSKTPVGKNGSIINVVTKNQSLIINGTKFTGHALDQMQARGIISPSAVLDVIANPATTYAGNMPDTRVFIRDNLKVVTNTVGDIITVIPQ